MYIYIHIYIHIYVHTHTYIYIHMYLDTHTCIWINLYIAYKPNDQWTTHCFLSQTTCFRIFLRRCVLLNACFVDWTTPISPRRVSLRMAISPRRTFSSARVAGWKWRYGEAIAKEGDTFLVKLWLIYDMYVWYMISDIWLIWYMIDIMVMDHSYL